jgi:hypothetical protein
MRLQVVTSAGGQVKNSTDRVKVVEFHARSTNGNSVYAGDKDVSVNNGRELEPGEAFQLDFSLAMSEGSVAFSELYVSTKGSDKVDVTVIKE